jgi:hypothetical protein
MPKHVILDKCGKTVVMLTRKTNNTEFLFFMKYHFGDAIRVGKISGACRTLWRDVKCIIPDISVRNPKG